MKKVLSLPDSRETYWIASTSSGGIHSAAADINMPRGVMGLTFGNALGLAAGIDRTGDKLALLAAAGTGHVEIGTVTTIQGITIDRGGLPDGLKVGINFASPRSGIDADVIEDYVGLLQGLWPLADYLVANLSSPSFGRTGDTIGVRQLIQQLAESRGRLYRDTATVRPLLIKIHAGPLGSPLPEALACARNVGLQGVVLVTSCTHRLRECCQELGDTEVISVAGIATRADAMARLAAGARLVQVYSTYVCEGADGLRRIRVGVGSNGRRECHPS